MAENHGSRSSRMKFLACLFKTKMDLYLKMCVVVIFCELFQAYKSGDASFRRGFARRICDRYSVDLPHNTAAGSCLPLPNPV